MKNAFFHNVLTALACAAAVVFATTAAASAAPIEQEPSRAYWLGLARYLAERGYVAAVSSRIEDREVEIRYKQVPVSKELGFTIDFDFAIPTWHIQGRLRKANYKIEETGDWVRNKTFSFCCIDPNDTKIDDTWKVVRGNATEIYKMKPPSARPLSAEIKQTILSYLVHHTVGAFEMANYRFSALEPFENRLWIYDTATGKLFDVSADGDLDSLETIRRGLPDYNSYDHRETDLADGPLRRMVTTENVVWLHGLWAALGGN